MLNREQMNRRIIIASTGTETLIFVDGKVYGERIERIEFEHTGGETAKIRVTANNLPLEGQEVRDGFRNFLNSLLDNAPKEVQEHCITEAFTKSK